MEWDRNSLLWTILAGIASSLGVLAILTALGGVVIASRFEQAGLTTEIAVAAVPRPVLLVLGVQMALPLALTTAAVVGTVAILHRLCSPGKHWKVAAAALLAVALLCAVGVLAMQNLGGSIVAQLSLLVAGLAAAAFVCIATWWAGDSRTVAMGAALGVAVASVGFAYEVYVTRGAHQSWLPILGAIVGGVVLAIAVMHTTENWVVQAGLLLLITMTTGGAVAWIRTRETPKVRPMAVVRTIEGRAPVGMVGIYVAATNDDLFMARVRIHCNEGNGDQQSADGPCPDATDLPDTGGLVVIPRADVVQIAIGTNVPLGKVNCRTQELLAEVLADTMPRGARTALAADVARGSEVLNGTELRAQAKACAG
jgi:hypothetical protein